MDAMRWLLLTMTSMALVGCANEPAPGPGARAPEAPSTDEAVERAASDAPVFGSLQTRHGTITTKLGPDGPLYTVTAPDGTLRALDIDSKALEEGFPELQLLMEADLQEGGAYAGRDYTGITGIGYAGE